MNLDTLQAKAKDIGQVLENFPGPSIPLDGDSYEFPNNADDLSDEQLDSWLMFFGAWRGYIINRIAQRDGEASLLSEGFDLMMASKSADLEAVATKRLLKESLRGTILNENPDLRTLSKKIMVSKAELRILKGRLSLYDAQFEAISRVITRRGQERQRA